MLLLAALLFRPRAAPINPATGQRQLSLIGESQEVAMGKEADGAIVPRMGLYGGEELHIQGVGSRIATVSERPQLGCDRPRRGRRSASTPSPLGGYIYITRGIMAHLNSEAWPP